jgi:heme/copper-type cytochrome/quinol oxidase subunit 2
VRNNADTEVSTRECGCRTQKLMIPIMTPSGHTNYTHVYIIIIIIIIIIVVVVVVVVVVAAAAAADNQNFKVQF